MLRYKGGSVPTPWRIVVDHINVGQGDSTLLRVYGPNDGSGAASGESKSEEILHKTVLIDGGGNGFDKYSDLIYKYITKIDSNIKINAIVLTHYDADHLDGIDGLLRKYKDEEEKNIAPDKRKFSPLFAKPLYIYDPGKIIVSDAIKPKPVILNKKGTLRDYIKTVNYLEKNGLAHQITPLSDEGTNILGNEIFWNDADKVKQPPSSISLRDFNINSQEKPGLFCIATNKQQISNNLFKSSGKMITGHEVTEKNKRSLGLVLVSPNNQILHYLCGDMDEENEEMVIKWLNSQFTRSKQSLIPAIKFSHHGSAGSTPMPNPDKGKLGLLETCKPTLGIISAGQNNTHGHPSYELLAYIFASNENEYLKKNNRKPLKVIATNFPDFLINVDIFKRRFFYPARIRSIKSNSDKYYKKPKKSKNIIFNDIDIKPEDIEDNYKLFDKIFGKKVFEDYFCALPIGKSSLLKDDERLSLFQGILEKSWNQFIFPTSIDKPQTEGIRIEYKPDGSDSWLNPAVKEVFSGKEIVLEDMEDDKVEEEFKDDKSKKPNINRSISLRAPSNEPLPASNILIKEGSDLDKIISQLPQGKSNINLSTASSTPDEKDITVKCELGGVVSDWLKIWGIEQTTMMLTGTLTESSLDVPVENIKLSSALRFRSLNTNQLPLMLTGVIKNFDGGVYVWNWNCSPNSPTLPLLTSATHVKFIDSSSPIIDVLNSLFSSKESPNLVISNKQGKPFTNFMFQSGQFGTNVFLTTQLRFTYSLGNFNLSADKLSINNATITFSSTNRYMSDDRASTISEARIDAEIDVLGKTIDTSMRLSPDSTGNLTFKPVDGIDILELIKFAAKLLPNIDDKSASSLNFLKNENFTLGKIEEVRLDFNLAQRKITYVDILLGLQVAQLNIAAKLHFPRFMIEGDLVASDIDEKPFISKDNIPASSAITNDDDEVYCAKQDLHDILTSHGGVLPTHDFPTHLTEVYFTAAIQDDIYTLSARVAEQWKITDQFILKEIDFYLEKKPGELTVSLGGYATIANTDVSLSGIYSSKNANNVWSFQTLISEINLADILDLFPDQENILATIKKHLPLKLENISLALQLTPQDPTEKYTIQFAVQKDKLSLGVAHRVFKGNKKPAQTMGILEYTLPELEGLPLANKLALPVDTVAMVFSSCVMEEAELTAFKAKLRSNDLFHDTYIPYLWDKLDQGALKQGMQLQLHSAHAWPNLPLNLDIIQGTQLRTPSLSRPLAAPLTTTNNNAKWKKLHKSLGPILLERIGLSYDSGVISILLDAYLALGPLQLILAGFAVKFTFSELDNIKVHLDGLGLEYKTPALTIEGELIRNKNAGDEKQNRDEKYTGMAIARAESFSLSAVGAYEKLAQGYTSLFLFAHLDIPLGGPPCFYVTGLSGGLGYNQQLRLPTQSNLLDFPLVKGINSTSPFRADPNDPIDVLNALMPVPTSNTDWIIPQQGEMWIGAGVNFTTFDLLHSKALFVAEFGKELQFGLIGHSDLILPPPADAFVKASMGIEAGFKPAEGVLHLTASLTPDSYILDRNCRLTGGFAFSAWFKGEHAGDFVVTLGGYHPHYSPPAHYPIEPRVGFNWPVTNTLSITGENYFALTPTCMMAGGDLSVLFHLGDLHAWFKSYGDFLIQWKPFYFEGDCGVDIGVSYKLDLWFTSVTVSAELGATVDLWGPPLGGEAHVHWWVISFSVGFGQNKPSPQVLGWNDFKKLLPSKQNEKSLQKDEKRAVNDEDDFEANLVIERGLILPAKSQPKAENICSVRAGELIFHTESAIPASEITLNDKPISSEQLKLINIKPLQKEGISSKQCVKVEMLDEKSADTWQPVNNNWQASVLTRKLPCSLWGKPSASPLWEDKDQQANLLTSNECVIDMPVGLTVKAPTAELQGSLKPIDIKNAFEVVATAFEAQPGPRINTTNSSIEPTTLSPQTLKALQTNGLFKSKRQGLAPQPDEKRVGVALPLPRKMKHH